MKSNNIALCLRRMAEEFENAAANNDQTARNEIIKNTRFHWGTVFKHRKIINTPARRFLGLLLVAISDPVIVNNTSILEGLSRVLFEFSRDLNGCTEKDVLSWIERLQDMGIDFAHPISRATEPE